MKPLIPEDLMSIKLFLTQIMGDYFNYESQILGGKMIVVISGKPCSIPDDIAQRVIQELEEYKYDCQINNRPTVGQVVVVYGKGGD